MTQGKGGRFRLLIKEGSQQWEFFSDNKSFTLGRTEKSTFVIPMQLLSSIHLELKHIEGNHWIVRDKKSTNGSFLKENKLDPEKPYQVESPFSIRIGQKTELLFQITDLVEGQLVNKDDLKTKELPKEKDPLQISAAAKAQYDLEDKQRELEQKRRDIEKQYQELKAASDQKNQEAYAVTHRLESLRKEAELAEKRRRALESDILELERSSQEKNDLKNFLNKEAMELQRRVAQLAEQETELKKSVSTFQSESEAYRLERDSVRQSLDEFLQKKGQLEADILAQQASLEDLRLSCNEQDKKLKEALDKETEAHKELHKTLKLIAEKEESLAAYANKTEHLKKEFDEKNATIEALNLKIDSLKRTQQQEERDYQSFSLKIQTMKEAMQLTETQRKASEAAVDTLRAELLSAEAKMRRLQSETHDLEDRATKLRSEVAAQTQKTQDLQDAVKRLETAETNLQSEHTTNLTRLKAELEAFEKEEKEKIASQLRVAKSDFEAWEKAERERVNLELKARKDDLLAWENSERERLQKTFVGQGEKLEKDLAERRQKELQAIEELKSKWTKERDAKRPLEIREIVRSSAEMLNAHLLGLKLESEKQQLFVDAFRKDLEGVVKAVLVSGQGAQVENHLKAALVQSPEETLKAQKKRKVWAIQAGAVLGVLLVSLIFPQIPQAIWETGSSAFKREPQSADQFVERIRQVRLNRPKFMPERDRVFRNTYTDNIIYLQDYEEIKSDPDIKKAWTLALNKFFVEKLDMDERIIVTFMAIESPLVRELTEMAGKIQIKNQDSDISRMRAFEDLSTPRLIEAVKGRENYDKLREFEYQFYDEYSQKLNGPQTPQ